MLPVNVKAEHSHGSETSVDTKAPFTPYNQLSIQLYNRGDNRLDVCLHDTAGCQTECTTSLTTGCIV